jgi:hydroxymethylbilane synthase
VAVTAERALLRRIEGGCQVPLGALATMAGEQLRLYASVCALDGSVSMECQDQAAAADAVALGVRVAEQLLARGAGDLIAQQRTPVNVELP